MEVTRRRRMESEVKWLKHYSSAQSILVVGDGDFSFSLALATAFGSGDNIVATSLDSYEDLTRSKAESNVMELKRMRATVLHRVDVNTMKTHSYLKMRLFDRIVFNIPHVRFKAKEYKEVNIVNFHKDLVKGFLCNARNLVWPHGEIHISHKTGYPYDAWDLVQLTSESSLVMIAKVSFKRDDYPGYNQKREEAEDQIECFQIATELANMVKALLPPEKSSTILRPVRPAVRQLIKCRPRS